MGRWGDLAGCAELVALLPQLPSFVSSLEHLSKITTEWMQKDFFDWRLNAPGQSCLVRPAVAPTACQLAAR